MSISPRRPRTYRSAELRRQIVEETLAPGASVSLVARAHNVNANLVFTWRRRYRQELLQNSDSSTLLPVRIVSPKPVPPKPTAAGILHLELPHAHLRIEGTPDPATLRTLLAHLLP
jgi:transposase